MTQTVHLFARLRDIAGPTAAVELPAGATVAELRQAITTAHPGLAPLLAVSRIAVNHEFAADVDEIPDGAELAVIPPVSGG
jgi:molybdopterin converting factor subunit 1